MAGHDIFNDTTPKQRLTPGRKPTIPELKAAIAASPQAASYPTNQLQRMTRNDLLAVCRAHSITVATTL